MRFCSNFYFNSRYCCFKTLSGLQLLQPLGRGFRWKKYLRWWHSLEQSASGWVLQAQAQAKCFVLQCIRVYYISLLTHTVILRHQLSYSGLPCTCGFCIGEKILCSLRFFGLISVRFLDLPYTPLSWCLPLFSSWCIGLLTTNIDHDRCIPWAYRLSQGQQMVLEKPWVSQNFCQISWVSHWGFLDFFARLRKFQSSGWCLNVLESECLELIFKTLWSLGFAIEEIKMSWACNENCFLVKFCI